jgi:hypothetical protein
MEENRSALERRGVDGRPDADVARDESPGRILVLRAREELAVGRETARVLSEAGTEPSASG